MIDSSSWILIPMGLSGLGSATDQSSDMPIIKSSENDETWHLRSIGLENEEVTHSTDSLHKMPGDHLELVSRMKA
jgi:hypothetical protein